MEHRESKRHYVYVLWSHKTRRVFYVGLSIDPERRFLHHLSNVNIRNTYGLLVRMRVIATADNRSDGLEMERLAIEKFSTNGRELYNRAGVQKAKHIQRELTTLTCDRFDANTMSALLSEINKRDLLKRAVLREAITDWLKKQARRRRKIAAQGASHSAL